MGVLEELRAGVTTRSFEETRAVAARFARTVFAKNAPATILLKGDLGAGKTAFVKGMAEGLGITQTVKSPSFNVCFIYDIPDSATKLVHVDAYRLADSAQFENLLLDEMAGENPLICVEWPENVADSFDASAMVVFADILPDGSHRYELS